MCPCIGVHRNSFLLRQQFSAYLARFPWMICEMRGRYLSVPPTRQDLIQGLFYSGDLREEEGGHESKLVPCWSILVIGSLGAMYTMLAVAKFPGTKPGDLAGHRFTGPRSPVQCESMLVIDTQPGKYASRPSWGWVPSEQVPSPGKRIVRWVLSGRTAAVL